MVYSIIAAVVRHQKKEALYLYFSITAQRGARRGGPKAVVLPRCLSKHWNRFSFGYGFFLPVDGRYVRFRFKSSPPSKAISPLNTSTLPPPKKKKYGFKYHRQTINVVDHVWPVDSLADLSSFSRKIGLVTNEQTFGRAVKHASVNFLRMSCQRCGPFFGN